MTEHSENNTLKDILSKMRRQSVYRHLKYLAVPAALLVFVAVYWALHANAIAMNTSEPVCGIEEHTHTAADCYAWVSWNGEVLDVEALINSSETESTEAAAGTEAAEGTGESESTEASSSTGAEESAVLTNLAQYVLSSEVQEGDTVIVNGLEYVYTFVCEQEEHVHTDSCYLDAAGTEDGDTDSEAADAGETGSESGEKGTETEEQSTENDGESGEEADENEDESSEESDEKEGDSEEEPGENEGDSEEDLNENEEDSEEESEEKEGDSEEELKENGEESLEELTEEELEALAAGESEAGIALLSIDAETEGVEYEVANCTYDSATGDFSVDVALEFAFSKTTGTSEYYEGIYDDSIITTEGYTVAYKIELPDGIIVPSDLMGIAWYGFDVAGNKQFEYYFVEDTDESGEGLGTYSAILVFEEGFISELSNEIFSGDLNFSGYASRSSYNTTDGNIYLKYGFDDELKITIEKSNITWDGSETVTEDISVKKTGKYNSADGTITYTIVVYSELGTGDTITLTDYFSDENLSDILGDMGTITIQSGTTKIRTWTSNTNGTTYEWNDGTTTIDESVELTAGSTGSVAPYYYIDADGKMIIALAGLDEANETLSTTNGNDNGGTTVIKQLNSWVITYTYEVDPESNVVYYSTNKVEVETEDKVADTTISKQTSATVSVSGTTMIAKSGSYDNNGTITWTIVVGDGQADLNGYVLSDSMLAEMESGSLTIEDIDGVKLTASSSFVLLYAKRVETTRTVDEEEIDGYEYTYYCDAACTEPVTIEVDETTGLPANTSTYPIVLLYEDENNDGTSELKMVFNGGTQYTITYKTALDSAWSSQYITNDAEITYDGTNTDNTGSGYEAVGSVWITGQGQNAFSKTNDNAEVDADDDSLYKLTWTTKYTVPSTGIPAGTTFTDYVSSSSGSGVHYFTYAQAVNIAYEVETAWGEENITDIQFCTSSSYWNNYNSDTNWVSVDSLDSSGNTVYYQFRFTTIYETEYYNATAMELSEEEESSLEIEGYFTRTETVNGVSVTKVYYSNNLVSYSYSTMANKKDYDTNSYYNYLTDSSITKSATWTWYENVVKYGATTSGYTSGTGTTKLTITDADGTVMWIVRVVVDDSSSTYTITDTLPAGVTLKELYVSKAGSSYDYEKITFRESTGTAETVEYDHIAGMGDFECYLTQDTNNTEEDLSDDVYTVQLTASELDDSVSKLYIKYVCSVVNAAPKSTEETSDGKTLTIKYEDLTNTVSVIKGENTPYGTSSETTTLTWKKDNEDTKDLIKEAEFDENNNVLNYSVLINSEGTTYTYTNSAGEEEEYDTLTVTDILSYYSYPMYGNVRSADLISGSLKLYYATVDDEGNVTRGSAVPASEYTWTLDAEVAATDWQEYITKTITLEVPNGVSLLLEYQYRITVYCDGTGWTDYGANVTNSAILSADGDELYSTTPTYNYEKIQDSATSASVSGNVGYTIYKVDADNFSVSLSGAVFTLYVYNDSKFSKIGTFTTSSSGTLTVSGTLVKDSNDEPSYYTVTMGDGTTADIPVDTICYLRETTAPEDYKVDGINYYFYFGSSISTTASDCNGYDSSRENIDNARNVIVSYTNYITNEHSSDYYANKTTLSVTKTWLDANGGSYTRTDGSITFDLYRVLILKDGTITSVADYEKTKNPDEEGDTGSGTGSGGTGSGTEDGKATLSWTIEDGMGISTSGSLSVEASADKPVEVTLSFYWPGLEWYPDWWWYAQVDLYEVEDNTWKYLARFNDQDNVYYENSEESVEVLDNELVKEAWIDEENYTYNFTIILTKDMVLYCEVGDCIIGYAEISDFTAWAVCDGTETEPGEQDDDDDDNTSQGETVTYDPGTIYALNFSEWYPSNSDKYPDNKDYFVNGEKYGTLEDGTNVSFFKVTGNLSVIHNSITWDLNGDGTEETLDVCLKMESKLNGDDSNPTNIQFTSEKGGYLRLVFNSEESVSVNSVTITDSKGNETSYYATNNQIYVYLDAGTYTVSRLSYCFLFYVEFAEGADKVADTSSTSYTHNFNSGRTSEGFYTISGDLSHSYGSISYKGVSASQCLKMGSKASITFTSEESGTLYLIMTNPKNSKSVGIVIDGTEVLATETRYKNSAGYTIYEITTRLTAGYHTITRINATENMLYYIEYIPDNYGGKSWKTDAETEALGYETYKNYLELVEEGIELSEENSWAWASSQLALEYLDTDSGEVLGYFVYFVLEEPTYDLTAEPDEYGNYPLVYTTTYLNNGGITGGSIGIANKDNSGTSVAVKKEWSYSSDLNDPENTALLSELEAAVETAEISYEIYAMMNIDDEDETNLTAGDSYERWFDSQTSDDFYIISNPEAAVTVNGGNLTYEGKTTSTALKMDSKGTVTFDAPATDATLTLVFSTKDRNGDSPNFSIKGPNEKTYKYSVNNGEVTCDKDSDPYKVTLDDYDIDNNVMVFTLTLSATGEYSILRNSSECYLYYIKYAYQYRNLVDGILTKSGTLTASSAITTKDADGNVVDTTYWAELYEGLPLNIFNDEGTSIIGTYSYYVKETGVTMTINGAAQTFTYDSASGKYTYTYSDDTNTTYIYSILPELSLNETNNDATINVASGTIAEGTLTLTNAVSYSSETTYYLPESGGTGTRRIYALAVLLIGLSGGLAIARKGRRQAG